MAQHIRKGDLVMVTKGQDRGRRGVVLRVIPKDQKVVVEDVNVHKRHTRPNQAQPQGGIIDKSLPIHWSNVSPLADEKPTRVRFQTQKDGMKVRVAARNGQVLGRELHKGKK